MKKMGLLEKAQQQKQKIEKKDDSNIKIVKDINDENKTDCKTKKLNQKNLKEEIKKPIEKKGLLEKAKEKKQKETKDEKEEKQEKKIIKKEIKLDKNKDVIEEKSGFGYKGMGTRMILFDKIEKQYYYYVTEPELSEEEKEIKQEISHLFKMLADVNAADMEKEEKEEFLIKTLDQIIKDNNIKFYGRKKKKTKEEQDKEKGLKNLFKKNDKAKETKEKLPKEEIEKIEKEKKEKIYYHLYRDFLGYGKINIIMEDQGIEDISCDGHKIPIFIYHKKYDEITSNIIYQDEVELNSFVVRLAQICGKQISVYSPIVDGKLPDGSRLQTTLARTVTRGSTFTIRKFKENPLTPIDLINYKSISLEMAAYFWMSIERGASILFCGGTASGKTTALNALSLFIPASHKIVTIEDTREINLPHDNWIAGTTRQGFSASDDKTGKDIDMFDLIRAALRQRPKVVMVGEVRGKEAYSLFQAMSTGHTSYATVHASDIHTLIQRLENPPISLPRALLTSLDIIVFQNAIDIKQKTVRRMTSVTEIVKLDPDTNQLIFMEPYKWISKTEDDFEPSGSSKILNNIRLQNDWSDLELCEEMEKRILVLRWMVKKNITDYREVGRIVNLYHKYPEDVLKKAQEEMIK